MRTSAERLWALIQPGAPLGIVLYRSLPDREELIQWVRAMVPSDIEVSHTTDIDAVFGQPNDLVLLAPTDEVGAMRSLGGRREAMVDRSRPALVFLLAGGDAIGSLGDLPALASWVEGRVVDPVVLDEHVTTSERESFVTDTNRTPEDWLRDWESGGMEDSRVNRELHLRALAVRRER